LGASDELQLPNKAHFFLFFYQLSTPSKEGYQDYATAKKKTHFFKKKRGEK